MTVAKPIVSFLLAALCAQAQHALAQGQTVLFSDDAERAVLEANVIGTGWTIAGDGVVATQAQAHSGRYSYASTANGGNNAVYASFSSSAVDPVYLKFWIYIPGNYSLSSGATQRLAGLLQAPGSWATYPISLTSRNGSLYLAAGGLPGGTHPVSKNAWHSIEMRYAVGAGQITVWLDGGQDISANGVSLQAKNQVLIGLAGTSGTIYFDDITVSNAQSTADCGLTVRHAYPGNRSKLKLQTYLWGQAATDRLVVSVDNSVVSSIAGPLPGLVAPTLDLTLVSKGSHVLQVQLVSAKGTRATYSETIQKALSGTPAVAIDENNNLVRNGHKLFPITGWMSNPQDANYWLANSYINASGWASEWSANYSIAQYKSFMEKDLNCVSANVSVMGPYHSRAGGSGSDAQNLGSYAQAFTSHPCVLLWSGYDEASVNGYSVATMQAAMNAIHSYDNNHPFIYDDATFPNIRLDWYYPNLAADIYSSDNYPTCYAPVYQSYGKTFADWIAMLDRDARANYNLVPNFAVLELFEFGGPGQKWNCTPLSAARIYSEAWLAVIHDRKGISWYDNGAAGGYQGNSSFPPNPQNHIGKFTKQIAEITPDAVLAAPGLRTVTSDMTSPGARVDVAIREFGNYMWIFAARVTDFIANPAEETAAPLATTITITGLGNTSAGNASTVQVLDENRTVRMTNGAISDSFSPYGVHIYKVPLPAPPQLSGTLK